MRIGLLAACLLVCAASGQAGVIYIQPVAHGGDDITGYTLSDLSMSLAPPAFQAVDDFRLGADYMITDLHWVGADLGDSHAEDFAVRFFEDNGSGQPGALLTEVDLTGVSRVDSGLDVPLMGGEVDVFRYNADVAAPFMLQADTPYYISILDDTGRDVNWAWAWGVDTTPGTQDHLTWTRVGDSDAWGSVTSHDMSFKLTGEPVPEPATLLLLGAGISALVLRRARRPL